MNDDLPDYLSPEYVKRVFDVNNAVMETKLDCKFPNSDCLECGDAECFMIFEAHAELLEMTLKEYTDSIKRQRENDREAVEAQTKRYEHYRRKFEAKPDKEKEPNLFNFEKVA